MQAVWDKEYEETETQKIARKVSRNIKSRQGFVKTGIVSIIALEEGGWKIRTIFWKSLIFSIKYSDI